MIVIPSPQLVELFPHTHTEENCKRWGVKWPIKGWKWKRELRNKWTKYYRQHASNWMQISDPNRHSVSYLPDITNPDSKKWLCELIIEEGQEYKAPNVKKNAEYYRRLSLEYATNPLGHANHHKKDKKPKNRRHLPIADRPWAGNFDSKPQNSNKADGQLEKWADDLRERATKAELALAEALTNNGISFAFQQPICGRYILDFLCARHKLGIEVDGDYHNSVEQWNNDHHRTNYIFKHAGIRIIRFDNEEVTRNMPHVLRKIKQFIQPTTG